MQVESILGRLSIGSLEEEPKVGKGRNHIKRSGEEKGDKKVWLHVNNFLFSTLAWPSPETAADFPALSLNPISNYFPVYGELTASN